MARHLALAILSMTLAACGTPGHPDFASDEERPCQSDRDCEVHTAESPARRAFCASNGVGLGSASAKDAAACGPIPNMTLNASDPELLCFRGSCVAVGAKP
jgi:hypothetical protein